MSEEIPQRLVAALRAQASGLGAGAPPGPRAAVPVPHAPASDRAPLRARWVLTLAALLGAAAGALAGLISVW